MQTTNLFRATAAALLIAGATSATHAAVVTANNPAGDTFTNASTVNQGQAIGSTGWGYNSVRNGGTVGINGTYARSGNGSVFMSGVNGPGGDSSKADIEYYAANLGSLSALSAMSYDWYRSSSSTNEAAQHPSLRVLLDADGDLATTGDRGSLIFERAYNSLPTTVDTWVSDGVSSSTYLWNTGLGLGFGFDIDGDGYNYDATLADWQAHLPNAVIVGFSSGFGSGWGPFEGAVDNISWTVAGQTTTSNFEIAQGNQVPEPATGMLLALGLLGLAAARRRL